MTSFPVQCVNDSPNTENGERHLRKGQIYRVLREDFCCEERHVLLYFLSGVPLSWNSRRFSDLRPGDEEMVRRIKKCKPAPSRVREDA